ncbi:hypothetical protein I3843_11G179600 [Carya illinoinensis]|nr:hypothetical protein I3843_11G179600 [Carya illinoinensis]
MSSERRLELELQVAEARANAQACCSCISGSISFIVFTCLAIWVFKGVDDPKSSIQSLYLPALNKTSLDTTTPTNNTLFFELQLSNSNDHWGIYYGNVNLTFYDNPISTRSHVIGNYTIPRFYQGYNKKATKRGAVEVNTTPVSQAFCSPKGYVAFRVEMETVIRFRIHSLFKSKRKKLMRRANVVINEQGVLIVNQDGIKLLEYSNASKHECCCVTVGIFVSLVVFNIFL